MYIALINYLKSVVLYLIVAVSLFESSNQIKGCHVVIHLCDSLANKLENTTGTEEKVGVHGFTLLKLISFLYWEFYNKGVVKGSLLTLPSRLIIALFFCLV